MLHVEPKIWFKNFTLFLIMNKISTVAFSFLTNYQSSKHQTAEMRRFLCEEMAWMIQGPSQLAKLLTTSTFWEDDCKNQSYLSW